jgi:hypothetical protein
MHAQVQLVYIKCCHIIMQTASTFLNRRSLSNVFITSLHFDNAPERQPLTPHFDNAPQRQPLTPSNVYDYRINILHDQMNKITVCSNSVCNLIYLKDEFQNPATVESLCIFLANRHQLNR